MMALAMVGMVAAPAFTSEAAGLTQAATPEQVTYGKVSDADIALLRQLFDADYYLAQNPDLAEYFAGDPEALFAHFCTLGIFEGRTCNANFDPAAYASAYDDLAFGNDILKYYEHYLTVGAAEGRNITTVEACAANGITVASLATPEVKITPMAFKIATIMGTTDFAAVQTSIDRAAIQAQETGSPVVIQAGDTAIVVEPTKEETPSSDTGETPAGDNGETNNDNPSSDNSANHLEGMTQIGTITTSSGFDLDIGIYVGQNGSGYGAWKQIHDKTTNKQTYSLEAKVGDYVAVMSENELEQGAPDSSRRIAYIPVCAYEASEGGNVVRSLSDEGYWDTEAGKYIDNSSLPKERVSNGKYGTYEIVSSLESGGEVYTSKYDTDGVLDSSGTDSTEYAVAITFGEFDDNSVEFTVGIEGDDGFYEVDTYNIDSELTQDTSELDEQNEPL